ncbi:heme NO-binding domain-containing protein [Rhodobacter sp. KR11]|jgi:hypothetical protein|uniref:heme NO-binding domain-containing protein n=1 Tax=Rhodobacter sp. KR11 TaxID=2974588 RepID=UPI00222325F3|nr:heme NO-binding domain-containing protein [Rhodobacter sp. KR11]MCW1919730.1 heme NO-binding domain-containing protein [Rhodobacter sp. KR11]
MLGLINRSFQFFVIDTWGVEAWETVASAIGLPFAGFEAMLSYDDSALDRVIDASSALLHRSRFSLMEDLGTYLVAHERQATVRRLLRFSGANFTDFLSSIEELPDRGRLVLPDLDLPGLALSDLGGGAFRLRCLSPISGAGHVIMGLLRAMADDYGALVLLEHLGVEGEEEVISIQIADLELYAARPFSLGISA